MNIDSKTRFTCNTSIENVQNFFFTFTSIIVYLKKLILFKKN